ncbi:MAG: hypothetical protein CMH82_00035 [Nocardioides sp.]|nr:hypothetical protein [Nocardioides sp.]|tara:strand:+ start:5943 stop:6755 length:813 start_codon:yes stop_codon:yes gene_type:complete
MIKLARSVVFSASLFLTCATAPSFAQGVPVIDSTNLAKNVEQLQTALTNIDKQIEQIEQLKTQIDKLTDIQGLLDEVLGSVTGPFEEIAGLYNQAQDIKDRAAKIADFKGLIGSLQVGDFQSLLNSLLDGGDGITMGDKMAAEALKETLETAGFDQETLTALNEDESGQGAQIAQAAATNAAGMAAAQFAYEESGKLIERIDGLVDQIGKTETLKESVDLNTRMAASTNYALASIARLNAAQGLIAGQNGINMAAEQAKDKKFFQIGGAK